MNAKTSTRGVEVDLATLARQDQHRAVSETALKAVRQVSRRRGTSADHRAMVKARRALKGLT